MGSKLITTYKEVDTLLSKLNQETASNIVIVGGQALNIWGHHYLKSYLTEEEKTGILASQDLDLLARKPEIIRCAEAWHGKATFPTMNDMTVSSGIVSFKDDSGGNVKIDFLSDVYGVKRDDIHKYLDAIPLSKVNVPILSPPLVLQSRIANLNGLGYSDKKLQREIDRVRLASEVNNRYLADTLNEGSIRESLNIAKFVFKRVLDKKAVVTTAIYGVNLLNSIPHLHPNWPEDFREKEWTRRSNYFNDAVSKYKDRVKYSPSFIKYQATRFSQTAFSNDLDRQRFLNKVEERHQIDNNTEESSQYPEL